MTEKPRRGNARAEERGVRRSTERCCKTYNSLVRLPGVAGSRGAGLPFCDCRMASAAHASLAARYEQPSPPRFTAFGVDLERPGALELVTRQIAHQREIILVCGDAAPTAGSATHVSRANHISRRPARPRLNAC